MAIKKKVHNIHLQNAYALFWNLQQRDEYFYCRPFYFLVLTLLWFVTSTAMNTTAKQRSWKRCKSNSVLPHTLNDREGYHLNISSGHARLNRIEALKNYRNLTILYCVPIQQNVQPNATNKAENERKQHYSVPEHVSIEWIIQMECGKIKT